MSPDSESLPNSVPAVTASRFDRNGVTVYNLALRLTGSPGAAWHASVAAFAAVAERVPAGAAPGIDDQDLVLMACWHARRLLSQIEADPAYAAQLRAHDEAQPALLPSAIPVGAANAALPIDQRELLGMNVLSGLDHAALATLLHADPGLLAVMIAEARLQLHDLLRGGQVAGGAGTAPEDRQAIALAALRQDGQLGGPEAQATLTSWLEADPAHQEVVAALEDAGNAYRAWPIAPAPEGLREAAVAASAAVAAPAPAVPPSAAPVETMPAGEHDRDVSAPGADDEEPFDPSATVEWSSSEVAALGLEGAPVRPASTPSSTDAGADDADLAWDKDDVAESPLVPPALRDRERAPRWHIALVGVLLVAVIVVLVLTFSSKDDPTTPTPPTPGTTTKKTKTTGSANPGTTIQLPTATIRIVL